MRRPKLDADIHADAADLQSLPLNISTAGDNEIIAAVDSNDVIRIYRAVLIATSANNLTFLDGGTLLSGVLPLATGQGLAFNFDTKPWLETSPGNNFNINLSVGTPVTGILYFTGGTTVITTPTTPPDGLIAEDGVTFLIAEDGTTFLVQE